MHLAGGVGAVQLKAMALDEDAVAVRPVGAGGTALHEAAVTVSVTVLLVTDPALLVTTT